MGMLTEEVDFVVPNVRDHHAHELHNYFTIERKRGYGLSRNPLDLLVGHAGFEPTTS